MVSSVSVCLYNLLVNVTMNLFYTYSDPFSVNCRTPANIRKSNFFNETSGLWSQNATGCHLSMSTTCYANIQMVGRAVYLCPKFAQELDVYGNMTEQLLGT